jgi:hypothetical protein
LISTAVTDTVECVERVWGPVKTITVTFDRDGRGTLENVVLYVDDAHSAVRSTIREVLGIDLKAAPPPTMPPPGGIKYPK